MGNNILMTDQQNSIPSGLPEYKVANFELLKEGFNLFAKAPGVFIAYLIIGWTLSFAAGYIPTLIGPVTSFLINVFHSAGFYILFHKLQENGSVKIEECLGAVDFLGQSTLANILYVLLIFVGCLLLIFPDLYLMIAYALFWPYLLFDRLPAWEALERSRKIVGLNFFGILSFVGICGVLNILGFFMLGIGLFLTIPTTTAATYLLYRQIKRHTTAALPNVTLNY